MTMHRISENLTIYDLFRLAYTKHIPDGCVILEVKNGQYKELWPTTNPKVLQNIQNEVDDDGA